MSRKLPSLREDTAVINSIRVDAYAAHPLFPNKVIIDMESIENQIRNHLVEQLSIKQAAYFESDDELSLDSLTQAELRVYIEKEYKIPTDLKSMPAETMESLGKLSEFIDNYLKNSNAA